MFEHGLSIVKWNIDTKDWLNIQDSRYEEAFWDKYGKSFRVVRNKDNMTISFVLPYSQEKLRKIANRLTRLDVYYYFGRKHIDLIAEGVLCSLGEVKSGCIENSWGKVYGITFNYEEPDNDNTSQLETEPINVGLTEFFGDMYHYANRYQNAFKRTSGPGGITGTNRIILTTTDDNGNIIEIAAPVFDDCEWDVG